MDMATVSLHHSFLSVPTSLESPHLFPCLSSSTKQVLLQHRVHVVLVFVAGAYPVIHQLPAEELMNNARRVYGHRGNLETLLTPSLLNLTSDLFKYTCKGGTGLVFLALNSAGTWKLYGVAAGGPSASRSPCSHPTEVHQSSVSAFLGSFHAKLSFFEVYLIDSLPPPPPPTLLTPATPPKE